jgi:hypothetical protein
MLCVLALSFAQPAVSQTADDTARILAGLPPAADSPFFAVTKDRGWKQHARYMNASWAVFERNIATRIQVWSKAKLPPSPKAMIYMFGGPDFPHANAFYPGASVYVLSGLEPVGFAPAAAAITSKKLGTSLTYMRRSLANYFAHGYFITSYMLKNLRAGKFTGTVPLLYVFLARSGKTINRIEFVMLGTNGDLVPAKGKKKPDGAKITFTGSDGVARTLYYFSTDLSNGGVKKSTFLAFVAKQGTAGSLVKSASYLLHNRGFSKVREFLMRQSTVIVQDDTGIPLRYFKRDEWKLRAFGRYVAPIPVFKGNYQSPMAKLFGRRGTERINFRMGYHTGAARTNVLVAEKKKESAKTQ